MSYEIMVFKHMQKVSCKPSNTIIKQMSYSHLIFLVSTPLKSLNFKRLRDKRLLVIDIGEKIKIEKKYPARDLKIGGSLRV